MSEIWNTWHDENFNCDKYLYHYTSFEKACKILFYNTLRFSVITKTNDTVESKVKFDFVKDGEIKHSTEKIERIKKYFDFLNGCVQLLCFSTDESKKEDKRVYTKTDDRYYVDMSGRGFALPRMWAQYADNNGGVCLIINKNRFEEEISKNYSIALIHSDKVLYKDFFEPYSIQADVIQNLSNSISQDENTIINGYNFLKRNLDYVQYAYFVKYRDWMNEKEYRYLISSDNKELKEVKNLFTYLDGIVLGEKIDPANEWQIMSLVENLNEEISENEKDDLNRRIIKVKKILFDYRSNRLVDVGGGEEDA